MFSLMENYKKRWAGLDDYLPPSAGVNRVGRNMANYFFFQALMRHGTFDEYHFFLANDAHRRLFADVHGPFLSSIGVSKKIVLRDRLELADKAVLNDFTVVHLNDHISLFNAVCRLRNAAGSQVPVTSFIHSISYADHMNKYLEMSLAGASHNDAIICSSECGKRVVLRCFDKISDRLSVPRAKTKLEVIPLGIDEIPAPLDRQKARSQFNFLDNQVVALCFGRFSDFDKMDLFPLLQAFKHAANNNSKLVLAGAVHEETYFKMVQLWTKALGLSEQVEFVIDPCEEQKRLLYSAADFFVSVADNPQETFGLTPLEAMAARLPLIVSDFDGYRELCSDDVGFRVPTAWCDLQELDALQAIMDGRTFHRLAAQSISVDVLALADAMKKLFEDTALRAKMSVASRARFEAYYSHKKTIGRLERLWDTLKTDFEPLPQTDDPLSLNISDTFSHYVTRQINLDDKVRISSFGKEFLANNFSYPLLSNINDLIVSGDIDKAMKRAVKPTIIKTLCQTFDQPTWKTRYLVMWMLKHELLELVD